MHAAIAALSVLGCLHSDLLVANQSQRIPSDVERIDAAVAAGRAQRNTGDFELALRDFQHGLQLSRDSNDATRIIRCLTLIGAAETRLFRYREALAAGQEAFQLARQKNNYTLAGAASSNISTIYRQLGDFPSAEHESARAVELLQRAPKSDTLAQDFLVRAMLIRTSLCFLQGKTSEGEAWSGRTIEAARRVKSRELEALAWDESGMALLSSHRPAEAGKVLQKAYDLWQSTRNEDELAVTKAHLAELELYKPTPDGNLALRLIDEALASTSKSFKAIPRYYSLHIRGQILQRLGQRTAALAEFRMAAQAADDWRRGALPGDTTSSRTVASLSEVHSDFARLAAELAIETHNSELKSEALEVLAENRAASLREQLASAFGRDFRLPVDYFHKLSELQAAQARVTLGPNSQEDKAKLTAIRLDLDALENQLGFQVGKTEWAGEKKSRRNSLRNIQERLSNNQLLLSFCLGRQKSFLWAISVGKVNLYQLPSDQTIGLKTAVFTDAVKNGRDISPSGRDLNEILFGQLPTALSQKSEWMIVGDGALLNGVPFAGLPEATRHSLRLLPSELLLLGPADRQPESRFIGIGDPIYNAADSRLRPERSGLRRRPSQADASEISLARLVGSANEIRASAKLSGLSDTQLLTGPLANSADLQKSLIRSPQVIHFAVHVVSPPEQPGEAALALSLKNGVPELLTTEEIATYRLPESLVVLSGCSSDQGKALAGAGLMGLSRAWLLAGAAAVVVSSWPTPDDSGRFFSAFYSRFQAEQKLNQAKPGQLARIAALALQRAQLDMRDGSGYSKAPSFWAAYSMISKE